MTRKQGWESKLDAVIERARNTPYALGEHDCFRVACETVEALTGRELWPAWAGRYASRREAMRLLAEYGSNFEDAGDKFFGVSRCDPKWARRGDVLAFMTVDGEKHLGICLGAKSALTGPDGVTFTDTLNGLCAWRIG